MLPRFRDVGRSRRRPPQAGSVVLSPKVGLVIASQRRSFILALNFPSDDD